MKSIKIDENYSYKYAFHIDAIGDEWLATAPENLFFSPLFLRFVEDNPPVGLTPLYVLLYESNKPIAVLSLQIKAIDLSESMALNKKDPNFIQKSSFAMKKWAGKISRFNTLICGSLLLTGEYGFSFHKPGLTYQEQFSTVEKTLVHLSKQLGKEEGIKIGPILMKDFFMDKQIKINQINNTKFEEFKIQPNMRFNLDPNWNNFDDYLAAMKSKYRVRVRRARKKLGDIEKRELSVDDIKVYNPLMYQLYKRISDDSSFNLFVLPENYFYDLKRTLGDKVKVVGYFIEDKLISYYTILYNKDYMEAHYLGYDETYNASHQTYLNMLYDMIEEGIHAQTDTIQMARTALEIKSSVGAQPYDMLCYLMHTSSLKNKILPPLLEWMLPEEQWTPRSPFKQEA